MTAEQRRLRRLEKKEIVAQIPNIFTSANIIAGFLSILYSMSGNPKAAAWLIIVGAFFDFMDGRIARFTRSCSEMGVQLDSLADFLTFGIAPAIFLFGIEVYSLSQWKLILPLMFIIAAAFRLARYNVTAEVDEKHDFKGLPSPGAALTIVSYYLFTEQVAFANLLFDYTTLLLLTSWLMVSNVHFYAKLGMGKKFRKLKSFVASIFMILIILKLQLFLFPILMSYILFCFVREIFILVHNIDFKHRRDEKCENLKEPSKSNEDLES